MFRFQSEKGGREGLGGVEVFAAWMERERERESKKGDACLVKRPRDRLIADR
jgi:hypothetical protein